MKIDKNRSSEIQEGDLTPMIDMTFQLIAFFMVLINFSQVERSEEIMLPSSMLAKPPLEPPEFQILLNLRKDGTVILTGREIENFPALKPILDRQVENAKRRKIKPEEINVIVRAHRDAPMRQVQKLISTCQDSKLESFSLRVMERRGR